MDNRIYIAVRSRVRRYYPRLTNIIYEIRVFLNPFKKYLIVDAFIEQRFGKPAVFNWGDDINYYVFKKLTNRNIIIYRTSFFPQLLHLKKYCLIGSIIGLNVNNRTIIWGSGVNIGFDQNLFKKPLKVCAVRGPLTRQFLLNCGVNCPEIYGDPALLLPYIYKPKDVKKKYTVGVIPHFIEKNKPVIGEISRKNVDIKIIDIQHYREWTDLIDEICECEYILSSSLHGLIVSDAYNIPNKFVQFGGINTSENYFKYRDYAMSVGRVFEEPTLLTNIEEFNNLLSKQEEYLPIRIDLGPLIKSCPFEININIK